MAQSFRSQRGGTILSRAAYAPAARTTEALFSGGDEGGRASFLVCAFGRVGARLWLRGGDMMQRRAPHGRSNGLKPRVLVPFLLLWLAGCTPTARRIEEPSKPAETSSRSEESP